MVSKAVIRVMVRVRIEAMRGLKVRGRKRDREKTRARNTRPHAEERSALVRITVRKK